MQVDFLKTVKVDWGLVCGQSFFFRDLECQREKIEFLCLLFEPSVLYGNV